MYHFECEGCGKRFEELVAYSGRDAVSCPDCQSQTRVLVASFATRVAGGGLTSSPAPSRQRFS